MRYGYFDDAAREYVIDRVDLPVSWTNYIGTGELYGVFNHTAGGYLIYLAYELLQNLINNVATTMPRFVQILAIVAFTGIGITLLVAAWKIWKKGREDQDKTPVDLEAQEDSATSEKDPLQK